MSSSSARFIGIDASGGRQPFTCAALDADRHLVALSSGELEDVLDLLGGGEGLLVAVNAPQRPNQGIVRKRLEQLNLSTGHLRGSDIRLAEYELRERGISISPTPSRTENCAAWIQSGFELYRRLTEMGLTAYPSSESSRQCLEVHPHAAFTVLLGQLPLPKPTLEGRLQRQLALYDQGLGIRDPMGFFEEITRHRLMRGILPVELVYSPEELDALVAAYLAHLAGTQPELVTAIGDRQEGQIYLPVAQLMEHYA
jgi:predicted RNase H-like nuclease